MAIINYSTITKAIESLLQNNLRGYIITRNEERNTDPNRAIDGGWIGIYRGNVSYDARVIGARPWNAILRPMIEIQVASVISGSDAEEKLQAAEKEVIDILSANKTLSGTVNMTNGYSMDYEYNPINNIYFHSVTITLNCETRA